MGLFLKEGVDETFSIEHHLRKFKSLSLHKEKKKNDRKNKKELNILYKYQGHPTTVFCKISVRRSKYCLEFSIAQTWLKISGLTLHSGTIFEAYLRNSLRFSDFILLPMLG